MYSIINYHSLVICFILKMFRKMLNQKSENYLSHSIPLLDRNIWHVPGFFLNDFAILLGRKTSLPAKYSPPPTGIGILGSILKICELNQIFHSQPINQTMILLLTNIVLWVITSHIQTVEHIQTFCQSVWKFDFKFAFLKSCEKINLLQLFINVIYQNMQYNFKWYSWL